MAFPTNRDMLATGLARAQSQASSIKRIAQNNRDRMAASGITSGGLISLLDNLLGAKGVLDGAKGLPGIAAYSQEQLGADVSADFVAMNRELTACIAFIIGALPKQGKYLLTEEIAADGTRTDRIFTAAQTAGLRDALDALIATIE